MPRCSVVIRAFNEEEHIGRLLTGISLQTEQDAEVVLVDSGSTDATVSIARHYGARVVTIRPEDFTFGRSLNLGIEAAKGEFTVAASAHVYPVYKDWLEVMLAPFENPKVALTYGRQVGNERTKFSEHQIFASWFPEESVAEQDTPFCNNANAAIRRELWLETPYDEDLTGLEDLDWARKAMDRGHNISYVAEAPVVHVHDETPWSIFNRYRREAIALKNISPEQHFDLWDFVRLFPANTASDLWQAFQQGQIGQVPDIFMFRFLQFLGTYRGFAQEGPVSGQLKRRFYYPNGGNGDADGAREDKRIDYGNITTDDAAAEAPTENPK